MTAIVILHLLVALLVAAASNPANPEYGSGRTERLLVIALAALFWPVVLVIVWLSRDLVQAQRSPSNNPDDYDPPQQEDWI